MKEGDSATSLEIDLAGALREAQSRWPGVTLDVDALRAHVASLGVRVLRFPADAVLAAACAVGDPVAMRSVESEIVARVPEMVRRIDPSAAFGSEISQQLRVRLFVREEAEAPRIARYTGEVPLAAWVRVIALRLALNAKRGRAAASIGDAANEAGVTDDPEIEYLRRQYREPFARAFEEALTGLPKDDRTVLRLHYVDGANIDAIGRIYQVHRATVARWLVRIRSDVLTRAKAILAERLGAELEEASSVMGALAAEVDVTLSRVLGAASA